MLMGLLKKSDKVEKALKHDLLKLPIHELHPLQFTVGRVEVEFLKAHIRRCLANGGGALDVEMRSRVGKVIIGPESRNYLLEGHHWAVALRESGVSELYVLVIRNWHEDDINTFWKRLEKNHFWAPKDETGSKRGPWELPASLLDLKRDPYRSLAWMLLQGGFIRKVDKPFQLNAWSNWLRARIRVPQDAKLDQLKEVFHLAVHEVRKHATKKLPGYWGFKAAEVQDILEGRLAAPRR